MTTSELRVQSAARSVNDASLRSAPFALRLDGPRSGADNMAIDALLLGRAERDGVTTLRLYRWDPPCLSFGRNEAALERYDRALIERLGLDVVRRPTGGRAVWHEHEVTYALAAPIAAFGSLKRAYCDIHLSLAKALRTLGAEAELAPDRHTTRAATSLSGGACFASPVGGEVMINGRKAVGSAQVRQGDAFLQHGSILLDGSQDIVTRVSRKGGTPPNAITLSEALGRTVTFDEVAEVVIAVFSDGEERRQKTEEDKEQLFSLLPSPFSDPSWTWRR